MKILVAVALCLLYLAAVVGLGSAFGPVASPWLIALLSLLFLLAYRWFVQGPLTVRRVYFGLPAGGLFLFPLSAPLRLPVWQMRRGLRRR